MSMRQKEKAGIIQRSRVWRYKQGFSQHCHFLRCDIEIKKCNIRDVHMYIFLMKYNACTFLINRHGFSINTVWCTKRDLNNIWREKNITYKCYFIYQIIKIMGVKSCAAVISVNTTHMLLWKYVIKKSLVVRKYCVYNIYKNMLTWII